MAGPVDDDRDWQGPFHTRQSRPSAGAADQRFLPQPPALVDHLVPSTTSSATRPWRTPPCVSGDGPPVQDEDRVHADASTVELGGLRLGVARPYSRKLQVLHEGRAVTRDGWDRYMVRAPDGQWVAVRVGFDQVQWGPTLSVGDHTALAVPRAALAVRLALLAAVIAATWTGGVFGLVLTLVAGTRSLALLRRRPRTRRDVVWAFVLPLLAVALGVLCASLVLAGLERW